MKKYELITNPVKYSNEFNRANISKLNSLEVNLLFTIFKGMMFKSNFQFEIDALCSMANTAKSEIRKDRIEYLLKSLIKNVFNLYIVAENDKVRKYIHLFKEMDFIYNEQKKIVGLKVILNEDGIKILHNLTNNFTMLDLEFHNRIQSTYVKSIFRLLSQYKSNGYFKIDYNEFIYTLGIPNSYEFKHIKKRILEPSIKILSTYFKNLKYKVIKETIDCVKQHKWIEYTFDKIIYKTPIESQYDNIELRTSEKQVLFYYNKVIEYNTEIANNKMMQCRDASKELEVNKVLARQRRNILGR